MLQAKTTVIPTETSDVKDVESATSILARIWPEYDPHGYGIMAEMMETVLRRVEKEQGASLLSQSSWEELGDYIVRVEGTIVSQRDLSELLSLLQGAPPPTTVPSVEIPIVGEEFHQLTSVSGLDIPQNYTNIGQSVEIRDGAHQRYGMMSPFSESVSAQSTQQSLHPRHHPSVHIRPRGNRPPIRKISLGESTQSRPRFSRSSRGSSSGDEDSDRSEHRMSPSSPGSRGSRSDASTSSSSPTIGDSKEWRANYNNMSIREQSRTEYEGYGLDAEYDSPANIESDQQKFLALQRKLKETERELEYQSRANEQAMAASMNQQEIEELRRDVIAKRREIEEFKKNDQYKSAQIAELTQQIEKSELSSSTQKSNAVAWKKRQDELMEDNARIRESLKQTEDALKPLITRLATAEALERRVGPYLIVYMAVFKLATAKLISWKIEQQ
ncbi:hypothetical protein BCR41DRAFT_79569 [Lobosporangium transversale]|uniref:Uncharacterized protein n=1 Tax=Lobosporangium transversale TaxID=64571 RepID=A0A1Y2GP76_9FUNG|nr:hypothetical protein BCR41DRAFT_79569 [Lobosporangium transversale]ORZ14919.1 hypothetical protein BCR41DRAFT_79569 [Lobosporangium transversale]|eukprot:XP_021881051.1 hypothetical protein BCR41DRAFT_79569 [Lobosporangium transversale]